MKKCLAAIALLILASPAFAADDASCSAWLASLKKASKTAGGEQMDDATAKFWKKSCLKSDNAEVKKSTACLDKAKSEAEVKKCLD